MKTPKNASYKWKLSPVNLMDMPRFQDWLNQMARQGLFYHWYSNKVLSFSLQQGPLLLPRGLQSGAVPGENP